MHYVWKNHVKGKHRRFVLVAFLLLVICFTAKHVVRRFSFRDDSEGEGYEQFFRGGITPNHAHIAVRAWPDMAPLTRLTFKRCAYVTGSGHLLGRNYGNEIDEHDCVIRSNDAPTAGYEKDVGRKTTIRMVDRRSLGFILKKLNGDWFVFDKNILKHTLVIMYHDGFAQKELDSFHAAWPLVPLAEVLPRKFEDIQNTFIKHMNNTRLWISSAFYTLLLTRDFCDEMAVYGISSPEYCASELENASSAVPYHYYERSVSECKVFESHSKANSSVHWFKREKEVFRKWIREWPHLKFRCPEWT